MGLEMELDSRKGRSKGLSPKTVLPSPRHSSDVGKRSLKEKPTRKDNILSLKEDYREISFGRFRSSSCKNVPSRPVGLEGNAEVKRGSIYQNSREVSKMKKRVSLEGRRKSEVPRSSDSTFSFRAIDSLCSPDEENQPERSSLTSQNSNLKTASGSKSCVEECSSDDFFEICLDSSREKIYTENVGCRPDQKNDGPRNNDIELLEKASSFTLYKSFSAKVGMSQLHSLSERDHSSRTSSKARFSPIRKMFDPFMKSKSLRSPLRDTMEVSRAKESCTADIKRNRASWKSLLDDFSKAPNSEVNSQAATTDRQHSLVAGSPVHLHACLKLENKDGMLYFEFSLRCPEEVYVAKTWKADNGFNWVYTFHSIDSTKRSNASTRGSNDSNKESSMVGQMQVSSYICSELRDDGALDNSVVTEFVLYDIARARKSVAHNFSTSSPDASESSKEFEKSSVGGFALNDVPYPENREMDSSYLYPFAPADLHPELEIAATVIRVPFEKRESLKYKRGDNIRDKLQSSLLKLSKIEHKGRILDKASPAKIKAVIPSGNHGLPSDESRCPSPLLDRWRLGGRCDCGGWDMACPLIVLGNPDLSSAEDCVLVEKQLPLELFVQGSKDIAPALTLTVTEEGVCAVDFHAQLSTLQAFSICVAILHSTEASITAGQERNVQLPQCSSLKMLLEEEVKFLIEAVTEEEKRKATKAKQEIPPASSFELNPPFSPIARV